MHLKITNSTLSVFSKSVNTYFYYEPPFSFQLRHFQPCYRGKVLIFKHVTKWKTTEVTNPLMWRSPTGNITWVTETSTLKLLKTSSWLINLFLSSKLKKEKLFQINNASPEFLPPSPSVSLYSAVVCFTHQQRIDHYQGPLWGCHCRRNPPTAVECLNQ